MPRDLVTAEIIAKLHELHAKVPVHVSARELADKLNAHPNSVRHWLAKAEVSGLVRCVVEAPERRYVPADVHP
jgi:hypothetical protein